MNKIILLQIVIFLFVGCNRSMNPFQTIESNIDRETLSYKLIIKGKEIPPSKTKVNLIEIKNSGKTSSGMFYDICYDKWIFRIRKEYLIEEGDKVISFDNRFIGNVVKKELPNEKLSFVREYFILDTGLDDIYLLPVIKKKN